MAIMTPREWAQAKTRRTNRKMIKEFALALFGVTSITWIEHRAQIKGVDVSLGHSWWTWKSLRTWNASRTMGVLMEKFDPEWDFVKVNCK